MNPAVKVSDWKQGAEALTLTPGEDDLALLLPAAEPVSVGEPPYAPDLVARLSTGHRVRLARCRSGELISHSLGTKARPVLTLAWSGLTLAERDTLTDWFRDTVQGTRNAFTIRPDGPDTTTVNVRLLTDMTSSWRSRPAYDILDVAVEEIFS